MKKHWCVCIVLLMVSHAIKADTKDPNSPDAIMLATWQAPIKNPNDPNEVLQVKWNAVAKVLQSKEIDQASKETIIDAIVSPIFDFELMSKLALGKTNLSKLTPAQYETFSQLFVKRLKDAYREKILLYKDEKATIGSAIPTKNTVQIPMLLVSGDKDITILYMLRKVDDGWKIYDVEIQGVSIVLTYRSQFTDTLRHGSYEELIAQLEKPATP